MAQYSSSCLISPNHLDLLNSPANRSFNGGLCGSEHAAANVAGLQYHHHQQQQNNSVIDAEGVMQGNTDQSNLLDVGEVHHSQQVNLQKSVMSMLRNSNDMDEYESKSSSDNPDAASGEDQEGGHERPTKKRYHRHSQYQIQEMERVFKECPHPDEKQRLELSRELKLDPRQVKFWFQNKRTQVKAQHERHDNAYLRTENEKLRAENLALRDAIANVTCPNCGGPANLSDSSFDEQQLRIENVRLREEIDRISKIAAKHVGRPISTLNLSSTISPSSTANSTNPNYSNPNSTQTNFIDHHQQAAEAHGAAGTFMQNTSIMTAGSSLIDSDQQLQLMAASRGGLPYMSSYSGSIFKAELLQGLSETEKPMVAEVGMAAMEELTQVAQASDPLWILQVHHDQHHLVADSNNSSSADGSGITSANYAMEVLDTQQYVQRFPASRLQYNNSAANPSLKARESTRQSAIIMMDAPSLVEILMNVANWADTFCSIVSRAFLVEVLSSGVASTQDGAMEIIYAEFQLPSPVVATRECYFLRYAKRMSYNNSIWAVVDVSIDRPNRTTSPRCRRRPSGCMIEDLGNGCSKVTWVEHWEVDADRAGVHRLYQPLVSSGLAFGAQRWVATLRRQCEAMHATNSMILGTNPSTDLVCPTLEGRRSLLKLAERMTNNFCGGVSASVAHTWITLSPGTGGGTAGTELLSTKTTPYGNGGAGTMGSDDIRVLIRKSVDDPGRPPGVVLCAATSIWLPLPPSRVFDFLRDERYRTEWDILSNMGPVEEIVHVPKGQDNANTVSLLRVNAVSSSQPNMLILQECCAEDNTYIVVYAPVDIAAMSAVLNGGDPDCVALLPSGFSILADRPPPSAQSQLATTSSSSPTTSTPIIGSLLTVAFQILVDHVPTAKLSLGSVATVNNLISSTVLRIKNALSCDSTPN